MADYFKEAMGIDYDLMRLAQERNEPKSGPRPEDIFLRGRDDTMVNHFICAWRAGNCTWEQAMMWAVIALSQENQRLRNQVDELAQLQPPPPIIVPRELYEQMKKETKE